MIRIISKWWKKFLKLKEFLLFCNNYPLIWANRRITFHLMFVIILISISEPCGIENRELLEKHYLTLFWSKIKRIATIGHSSLETAKKLYDNKYSNFSWIFLLANKIDYQYQRLQYVDFNVFDKKFLKGTSFMVPIWMW